MSKPNKKALYYLQNRARLLARSNERYRSMSLEQRAEHNRKRRERHARNPDIRNRVERKRDHMKRAGEPFNQGIWDIVKMKYDNACIYCGSRENITVEHRLPVSLGGTNDFHNLAPACLSCNSSKRNKREDEYREWRESRGLVTVPVMEVVYDVW